MDKRTLWAAALFLFVVGDGVATQVRGALLPNSKGSFSVSDSLLGPVAPAGTVGYLVAAVAVGFAADRIDTRRFLLLGAGGTAVCLLLLSQVPTYALFLVLLCGQGMAIGVFRGLDRPLLGTLYPDQRGRLFNLYGFTWAVGAVAGPLVVNQVLATRDWQFTFVVMALSFLPSFVLVARLELPAAFDHGRSFSLQELRDLLGRPTIAGMGVALVCSGAIEGGLFTWLPTFTGQFFARSTANVSLSVLLVAYIPGRYTYSRLADRVEPLVLVLTLALVPIPALVYVFVLGDGVGVFVGIFVLGFCLSGLFPTLSAFGIDAVPHHSGPVNAIAIGANFLGLSVFPVIVGIVSEGHGIATGMRLSVLAMAAFVLVVSTTRYYERGP
jgi:fucose permease